MGMDDLRFYVLFNSTIKHGDEITTNKGSPVLRIHFPGSLEHKVSANESILRDHQSRVDNFRSFLG